MVIKHPSRLSRRLSVKTNLLQEVEAVGGEESVREPFPPGCGVQKGPDVCLQGARVTVGYVCLFFIHVVLEEEVAAAFVTANGDPNKIPNPTSLST